MARARMTRASVRSSAMVALMTAAAMTVFVETVATQPPLRHRRRRPAAASVRAGRGRPRKFNRPSRAVTLTLPEDVITALTTIDADLSLAVVRTMQQLAPTPERSPAELTAFATDRAVIVVPRSRALRARTGVELVPLSDGRALLAFDGRLSVSKFELALMDALADPALEGEDRLLFTALVDILKNARSNDGVRVGRQNIVILRWTGSPNQPADSEPVA